MQDTAPRASLALLFAPPDDDDTAPVASGSGVASEAEEGRVSAGEDPSDGTQAEVFDRRSAVGPRVSILGPLPDIPRWVTLMQICT